jgi:enterochelin esterase-like enzyme
VGLTSPALLYLLAILTGFMLAAIIIDWPAMARRNLRSVAERTVSLVALQAFVLAFIFVAVNRSGEFYSSWSDLFGLDKASAAVIASTGTGVLRVQSIVVTNRIPVTVPGNKAVGGVLETVTFNGQLSGIRVGGQVFLPAGYRPGSRVGHYPVLVEISDNLARTSSNYGAVRLAEDAARQIAAGYLEPLIIVMLPASLSASDQGCLDVPAETAAGGEEAKPAIMAATFFSQDLPATIESEYDASSNSANWGLVGDSSGGYCALQLAMTNSWVFSAAVAPDGAYTYPPGPAVNAGSPQLTQQDNLQWLLRNQPMQPVSVLFTASGSGSASDSGSSARGAQMFAAAVRHPMQVSTQTVGGGSWPLAPVLDWIGAAVALRSGHAPRAPAR